MSQDEKRFLPYGRHLVDEADIAAVAAVLRSDYLTTGPVVTAFERAMAARVGARFALSCSSGTGALHLAALALGLGHGDAVVVPTMTFLATANAARYVGAEVIFADVDPQSGLMTEETLNDALTRAERSGAKLDAIFPVHLNGQCVDLEMVARHAEARGLKVVEDACHVLGGAYRSGGGDDVPVGSCRFGDMAVFSLHPVKVIAMGEGGVVTTDDEELRDRLVRYRNHGMVRAPSAFEDARLAFDCEGDPGPWYYEMPDPGYNYRASDIHCALGLSQLKKLDRFVAARGDLVARYDAALAELAPVVRPLRRVPWCRPAWHLYVVLIDFAAAGIERAALMKRLRAAGIGTQVHYLPVHLQPYYRRRYGEQSLAGAEAYYRGCLSLPLFPAMGEADVDRVVNALQEALGLTPETGR